MSISKEVLELRLKQLIDEFSDEASASPFDPMQVALRHCAVPRWFDRQIYSKILTYGMENAPPFDDVIKNISVTGLPGTGERYAVSDPYRTNLIGVGQTSNQPEDLGSTALNASTLLRISQQLAAWFADEAHPDEIERLYHLIVADRNDAAVLFTRLIDAAIKRFDLPYCHAILRTMDERQSMLEGHLAGLVIDRRRQVTARSLWAREYYESITYFERDQTRSWFDELMGLRSETSSNAHGAIGATARQSRDHWLLHVFAGGGLGKTMFIRATIAQKCVVRGIPCARIDFDFVPHLAVVADEPWRLLLNIADQLDPQWPARPFSGLLKDYRDYVAEASGQAIRMPRDIQSLESDDHRQGVAKRVTDRFCQILVELGSNPPGADPGNVLLVFDTLENLRAKGLNLAPLCEVLSDLHARVPGLRCIMAGRYDLTEPEALPLAVQAAASRNTAPPPFVRIFADAYRKEQLLGFNPAEARLYLENPRQLAGDPRVDAMVEKACKEEDGEPRANPFILALLADIVSTTPLEQLSAEDIRNYPDANLTYLIERVVERIENRLVRWLLRYGVVPRQLTLDYVQVVTRPYLERVHSTGNVDEDDYRSDDLGKLGRKRQPWAMESHSLDDGNLDIDALWRHLYSYTSGYSWVSSVSHAGDMVTFHSDVVTPMRRLIESKSIYPLLIRDTIAYYVARRDASDSSDWPRWVREIVYHRYQLDPAAADAAWLQDLATAGHHEVQALALADAVLSEVQAGRASHAVRARASYTLAYHRLSNPKPLGDDERLRVEEWLRTIEVVSDATPKVIERPQVEFLRGRLAFDRGNTDAAAAACEAGLAQPTDAICTVDLESLYADVLSVRRQHDEAIDHRRSALARAADAHLRRRMVDVGLQLATALAERDRLEESEQAFERAWHDALDYLEASERSTTTVAPLDDGSGRRRLWEALLGLVDVIGRMGQEATAVALGTRRLGEQRQWSAAASDFATAAVVRRLTAEIQLLDGHPDAALTTLDTPTSTGTASLNDRATLIALTGLRARIAEALLDISTAVRCFETMAHELYVSGTPESVRALIACARVHAVHTRGWLEARRFLEKAAREIVVATDPDSTVLWVIVDSHIPIAVWEDSKMTRTVELLRLAGRMNTTLEQVPLGLRAQSVVAEASRTGPSTAIVGRLRSVLEDIPSPSWRLRLLGALAPSPGRVTPVGAPTTRAIGAWSLQWAESVDREIDWIRGFQRLAAISVWLGELDAARLQVAAAWSRARRSQSLAFVRSVLMSHDDAGWTRTELAETVLPNITDSARAAMPNICGLLLLEQAERLWSGLGPPSDGTVGASMASMDSNLPAHTSVADLPAHVLACLDDAMNLLGTAQTQWNARIARLRAFVTVTQGDLDGARDAARLASSLFEHAGDVPAGNAMNALLADLDSNARGPVAVPTTTRILETDLSLERDGTISATYVLAGSTSARRWEESLFRVEKGESVGSAFVNALNDNWGTVTRLLADVLCEAPDGMVLPPLADTRFSRIALRTDPELAWVPWELARFSDARPSSLATMDTRFGLFRRQRSRFMHDPLLGSPGRVLIVRAGSEWERAESRGMEQATGVSLMSLYRKAGIHVEEVVQPDRYAIENWVRKMQPSVIHITAGLADRWGTGPTLEFGAGDAAAASEPPEKGLPAGANPLTSSELARIFMEARPIALVVVDATTPPTFSERLHQLCLRNAFLASVADVSGVQTLLGIGLAEPAEQLLMVESLAQSIAKGSTGAELVHALRLPAPAIIQSDSAGHGVDSAPDLRYGLPFAAATMFTDDPDMPVLPAT